MFIAVTTGGAYAIERIGSAEVANDSLRSADLRDRKAVKGKDVKRNSLTGKEVREASLDASGFARVGESATPWTPIRARPRRSSAWQRRSSSIRPARILVVATGGQYTDNGGADGSRAGCDIRVDGAPRPAFATPGEDESRTNAGATNRFARTLVTPQALPAGSHEIALACWELDPDVRIETPTIAALAISAG